MKWFHKKEKPSPSKELLSQEFLRLENAINLAHNKGIGLDKEPFTKEQYIVLSYWLNELLLFKKMETPNGKN